MTLAVTLNVNGDRRLVRVNPSRTLLEVLRDELELTGAKKGCNQGVCGACTVLIDGRAERACLTLAASCADREITTVEGLSTNGELTRLQQAFLDAGAVQCGFCTPGMLLSSTELLRIHPHPTASEVQSGISGNLCRCSGYKKIVDAVLAVGKQQR